MSTSNSSIVVYYIFYYIWWSVEGSLTIRFCDRPVSDDRRIEVFESGIGWHIIFTYILCLLSLFVK